MSGPERPRVPNLVARCARHLRADDDVLRRARTSLATSTIYRRCCRDRQSTTSTACSTAARGPPQPGVGRQSGKVWSRLPTCRRRCGSAWHSSSSPRQLVHPHERCTGSRTPRPVHSSPDNAVIVDGTNSSIDGGFRELPPDHAEVHRDVVAAAAACRRRAVGRARTGWTASSTPAGRPASAVMTRPSRRGPGGEGDVGNILHTS